MPLRKFSRAGRYRREGGIGFPSLLQKRRLKSQEKQGPVVCNEHVIIQSEDAIQRAWHEVPGTTPPQKSRPVGYGVIPVGVCPIWISCARSHRTLRDGSFDGRFPRHFVPGYDRVVPPGRAFGHFANRLYLLDLHEAASGREMDPCGVDRRGMVGGAISG
jgi:hypothetical protein